MISFRLSWREKNGRSAEAKKMTRAGEGADLSDEGGGRYSQFA